MRNKLYLECTSGISGDMTVAALLDLGADQKKLVRTLKSLPVKGFDIKISRVMKSGIDACDFDVLLDHDHENHDHDMKYLHGDDGDFHGHNHENIIMIMGVPGMDTIITSIVALTRSWRLSTTQI